MAYEIAEQLSWRLPQHTIVPMASGSLLTKIHKGYQEFVKLGLVASSETAHPWRASWPAVRRSPSRKKPAWISSSPSKPDTIANSLAIGTPADGFYALKVMRETEAAADDVTRRRDPRRHQAARGDRRHLCRDRRRRDRGRLAKKPLSPAARSRANSSAVICVTGNGLKTLDAVQGHCGKPREIKPVACVNLRRYWHMRKRYWCVKKRRYEMKA